MTIKSPEQQGEMSSIPCNLCGSRWVQVVSLKDRNRDYLRTVICRQCGLIWSDPRPSQEEIDFFYSKNYRFEYKGQIEPKKKRIYRNAKKAIERYKFFRDILRKNDKLLDIGAGNGVFVYCLQRLGVKAVGIEPEEETALYAREKLGVPVKTGFAKQTNKAESFDIVTLYHVLEHMADPMVELENIWNILKREGFLVVEVPNAEDLKQDPKNRYHKAHLYTFNPETLIGLGQRAGFQAIRKKIEPFNGNISVIFQKKAKGIDRSIELKSNYLRIMTILTTNNNKRHFLSIVPYKKFVQNMFEAISEQIKVRKFNNHKDIIDAVISGNLK